MLSSKVDNIRSTGGGGGGGISDDKVNAMEGRLSHHLQELKYNGLLLVLIMICVELTLLQVEGN